MKCNKVKQLIGAYLDSELDTQVTQQVLRHLDQCPACAALCRREQAFEAALRRKLQASSRTPALWEAEEALVGETFRAREDRVAAEAEPNSATATWFSKWRDLLWPSPLYYAGLAAVWLFLLVAAPGTPEPAKQTAMHRHRMSTTSRLALLEQRRELQKLLAAPEAAAPETEGPFLQPRSERNKQSYDASIHSAPRPSGGPRGILAA
ncbi:MAG: zf-HC2 domain-containing protein [Verrucomicrobia bacterium]|nr:zf-HC2 domain-containing protein [Verrucomicrobiota bacterium]